MLSGEQNKGCKVKKNIFIAHTYIKRLKELKIWIFSKKCITV